MCVYAWDLNRITTQIGYTDTTSICMDFGRSCTVEEKNSQEGASFVHDQKYITLSDPNYKSLLTLLENPKKSK